MQFEIDRHSIMLDIFFIRFLFVCARNVQLTRSQQISITNIYLRFCLFLFIHSISLCLAFVRSLWFGVAISFAYAIQSIKKKSASSEVVGNLNYKWTYSSCCDVGLLCVSACARCSIVIKVIWESAVGDLFRYTHYVNIF